MSLGDTNQSKGDPKNPSSKSGKVVRQTDRQCARKLVSHMGRGCVRDIRKGQVHPHIWNWEGEFREKEHTLAR